MILKRRGILEWLVATLVIFLGLLYPAMVYLDLAGVGGYDGFAWMMLDHGAWRVEGERPTAVYLIFAALYVVWLLSVVSLMLGCLLLGIWAVLRRRAQE